MNRNPVRSFKNLDAMKRAGTYRKERHDHQRGPTATAGPPPKPDTLDAVASSAWDGIVSALTDMAILHTVDGLAIYQYAKLYAETEGIGAQQANLRASAQALNTALGGLTGNDLTLAIAQLGNLAKLDAKCTDQLRAGRVAIRLYLVEFGLTSASRTRIRIPEPKAAEADPFAALAGQRPA